MASQTRQWLLTNPPVADIKLSGDDATFSLVTKELPPVGPNQALVKTLYLSNDPAQRTWIQKDQDPERLYLPPVQKDTPMKAFGICEVVQSEAENLKKGDLVLTEANWTEYSVQDAAALRPVQPDPEHGIKPTHFLGSLGFTGMTAYWGLVDVVRTTASDTVVVSGAAGATGSMVVQIAKHLVGCKRIIGIAGSDEKCRWVESLGADTCINYKSKSFKEDLIKATEGYVEVYYDNVGGEILDLMLTRMKRHGRIAACGAISNYNNGNEKQISNWNEVIFNRIEIRGLIVLDAMPKMGEIMETLSKGVKDGKIKMTEESETIVKSKFEDIPSTWMMLFQGGNQGKLITQLV
ncbi:NAD(P)-binding protein [Delitschia confertaspora ATCC 74209]|uniref:NAD(P)-binding protein n=1 Tax=Delitschia confertaspora ATCC 74209 TaxID=1513339 RepID=A0A9P4N1X4_9PLEO|nr:NAD(P)-binding protein [Delitschia confertaspora ATCC 74209]